MIGVREMLVWRALCRALTHIRECSVPTRQEEDSMTPEEVLALQWPDLSGMSQTDWKFEDLLTHPVLAMMFPVQERDPPDAPCQKRNGDNSAENLGIQGKIETFDQEPISNRISDHNTQPGVCMCLAMHTLPLKRNDQPETYPQGLAMQHERGSITEEAMLDG